MKILNILLFSILLIPAALSAQMNVRDVLEKIGDQTLIEAYNAFQDKPNRSTMDNFNNLLYVFNSNLQRQNSIVRDPLTDFHYWKITNANNIHSYFYSVLDFNIVRVKATKFSFPDYRPNKDMPIDWNLRIEISLMRELIFGRIPVFQGDFTELSIPTINGEVALNQPFDNDYISFRYMTYFGQDTRYDKRSAVSKFFEVSKYEVIAKAIDTGECEFEFADDNIGASFSVKFYNIPAVSLLPFNGTEQSN